MNERDIFLAAIEIADPIERAAYVDQACGSDSGMRTKIEELLKSHAQTSQFMEKPAMAIDSSIEQTIQCDSSDSDLDSSADRTSGEAEFRKYLQPASRPGWLGRLAHYEIEEILGRGAFGIVAKAFDEKLHRVVAIKLMNPELATTSPPRKRFLREARTAAAVTHENIVTIFAVEEEPIPYLVMEYVPGQTLQQRMDKHGPFELADVLRIGQQVASGLAAAHAVNLIHRDIKPSNILISDGPNERAKISDFGLARAVDDASLTSSGLIAGTPMYMAPEQARGETLDHRADLFSLGSVLYQMVSGRPPFRAANTVAVLKRVCEDTPRPLDDVIPETPDWLETIIFRLLEKVRDDRFQSTHEVADLLSLCQSELDHNGMVTCVNVRSESDETQLIQVKSATSSSPGKKPVRWLIGGAVLLLAVATIYMNLPGPRAWRRGAWDAADHNRDGRLTRQEMELFVTQAPHRNGPRLLWHFDSADKNHDDIVDNEEVEAYGYNVGSMDPDDHLPPPDAGDPVSDMSNDPNKNITTTTIDTATISAETSGWNGWPADAPPPAIAPFDAVQAKAYQEAWAKYLDLPIEKEISLGKNKKGEDVTLEMILIPPGEFMMGVNDSEKTKWYKEAKRENPDWKDDRFISIHMEGPDHFVRITKPFWLSKLEFKTGQFQRFVESTGYLTDAETSGKGAVGYARGEAIERKPGLNWSNWGKVSVDYGPVVNVSWNDAAKCCEWMSTLNPNMTFSLPTEAQWEFACRAGTKNSIYDCETSAELREYAQFGEEVFFIKPGGQHKPNAFGLYDMLGNVTEWCADWAEGYKNSPTNDPSGPSTPMQKYPLRACRGGSFLHSTWLVRSSRREFISPDHCFFDRGFRVTASIPDDLNSEK